MVSLNSEGSIDNLSILNFQSTMGPLIAFSEIEVYFKMTSILIKYNTPNLIPLIQLFIIWNSNLLISDVFIPFFQGKSIFSIQSNSNVKLSLLKISNVSSSIGDRGCFCEISSNSVVYLTNSFFFDFSSNTSFLFSYMATCYFSNLHFKSIFLSQDPNGNYLTSGFLIQSSSAFLTNLTIIDYNLEFLYSETSELKVIGCNFTNIDNIEYEVYSNYGTAIESAWTNANLEITNCFFSDLTHSDKGSVLNIFIEIKIFFFRR